MLRQHIGLFPKSLFRKQQQPYPLFFNIICFASGAACSAAWISALKHSLAVCSREKWSCRNQCCSKVIAQKWLYFIRESGEVQKTTFSYWIYASIFPSRKMWILCHVSSVSSSASTIYLGKGNSSLLPISNLKYTVGAVFHLKCKLKRCDCKYYFFPLTA